MSDMTFAQRLRMHRERAGKTRPVLGGLVGRSAEWVKALETGKLLTPRLPMLLRIAEVLGVDDLAELTGTQSLPVASVTKADHDATPTIAEAMRRPVWRLDDPPELSAVVESINAGWSLWNRSDRERTAVAAVLPELLGMVRAAVRASDGPQRRKALAETARVYHLVQLFMAYQPAAELVWLATDRARAAAEDADDPTAIAAASWYAAHVWRTSGQLEAAEQVAEDALPLLDPANEQHRPVWAQLNLALALARGKAGHEGTAWRAWEAASAAVDTLGAGYQHPWLPIGRAQLDAYAVTLDTDLFHAGRATRRVERFDPDRLPSRTRRAFYLIEGARSHHQRRDQVATLQLLQWALRESTETVRHNSFARMASLELAEGRGPVARDARDLALAIGTLG